SVAKTGKLLTVEEHNIYGGMGSALCEALSVRHPVPTAMIGINDTFAESGPYEPLLEKYGLSANNIVAKAKALLS
ncbi:MAG: transketolase family protein, partial [Sedimentisphaerales bacterium]|nr:transketolase family protein [Sedimentisphaerales bacterium]